MREVRIGFTIWLCSRQCLTTATAPRFMDPELLFTYLMVKITFWWIFGIVVLHVAGRLKDRTRTIDVAVFSRLVLLGVSWSLAIGWLVGRWTQEDPYLFVVTVASSLLLGFFLEWRYQKIRGEIRQATGK